MSWKVSSQFSSYLTLDRPNLLNPQMFYTRDTKPHFNQRLNKTYKMVIGIMKNQIKATILIKLLKVFILRSARPKTSSEK